MQLDYYRYRMDGSQKVEQYSWDTAISPIKEVENVNVPILIVHGDVDQRVPPEHFEKYVDELDRAGVSYKKLILEDADHFSNTLFYHHKLSLYESMLEFLKNDCGLQAESSNLASTVDAH
jgi:dipeptidyl aminopeptidase/acylaminoacyl peptidase